MNAVTIRITEDLANQLHAMKHRGESYGDIISAAISKSEPTGYILTDRQNDIVEEIAANRGMTPTTLIREWVDKMIEVNHEPDR